MKDQALKYLRIALDNPDTSFRDGQWESIEQLLQRKRVLVVQRTGWGKSMVYFLATKLLRERGLGPTLLISPLLSLMRNQLVAAERIGVTARAINCTNRDEWPGIKEDLFADRIDALFISPERLANTQFQEEVLSRITERVGLFVVDEAHCISDWGHDFRPDYRRITRILQAMPANVPVLATTATANNRVVRDIREQMTESIMVQKGSLVRKSLKLQNISLPDSAARMAWLARTVPSLEGSGIIYTLTTRDAERVAEWLVENDISAEYYHAGAENREELEQQLLNNQVKALVATVALGMGFDKPDLGFVIHFQRPASVVHYYQQVGRAGRAVDEAYGILLCGKEDDSIADYFIKTAFPPQHNISSILKILDQSDDGLSITEMQRALNLRQSEISKTLKFLSIESPSPVLKMGSKWRVTASASGYTVNMKYINSIMNIRRLEQQQMQEYMQYEGCLMAFLQKALDDPDFKDCGQCSNCNPDRRLSEDCDQELTRKAVSFLRRSHQKIRPRKRWPITGMFEHSLARGYSIPAELQASEGRTLSLWGDSGWGQMVADGKYKYEHFSDELVFACLEMIEEWKPDPFPRWITCIPSKSHPALVSDFAGRLANALGLPFVPCIEVKNQHRPQKEMENSYQQARNLDGAFRITNQCLSGECFLVDDMIDSGWTFTIASAQLRKAGCAAVYPLALAQNSPRMG